MKDDLERESAVAAVCCRRTRRGWRLMQHGTVLSEVLTHPGPTHSVFDVLAAAADLHPAPRTMAVLGMGGGSLIMALRALGQQCRVEGVDWDDRGWRLLGRYQKGLQPICWYQGEATEWLRRRRRRFDVVVEDLSVGVNGDVTKPEATWTTLPHWVMRRLAPEGWAVWNLLCPPGRNWAWVEREWGGGQERGWWVIFEDFDNRLRLFPGRNADGVTGGGLDARGIGRELRGRLERLGSRMATGWRVRAVNR